MKMSDQINEFATAFSKAQGMLTSASKDASNPFFKSTYATLASVMEAIREPLASNGLSFSQPCRFEDNGRIVVETIIMHSSGQYIMSELSATPTKQDPQSVGSLVSYLKRYLLQAMIGIASADDDGEAATSHNNSCQKKAPVKVEPPKKVEAPVDELFEKIISLLKKVTNGFTAEEKLGFLQREIRVDSANQIKAMNEYDKMDIINLLAQKIQDEKK